MPPLSSICFFCVALSPATVLADPQDASCPGQSEGYFSSGGASGNTCDAGKAKRGLLQKSFERLSHPAFVPGEEVVPTSNLEQVSVSKMASSSRKEASVADTTGTRVKVIKGLQSFGKGITSAQELVFTRLATGNVEKNVEPSLPGGSVHEYGYPLMISVGDVSSVLIRKYPIRKGRDAHHMPMLVDDSAQALRAVGLLALVVIIIVSILIMLLLSLAGSKGEADREEIFSSDSENFETVRRSPYSKSSCPGMPGRQKGTGGSPYASPALPNERMQTPSSSTQLMPLPPPMAPPADTSNATSRPPKTSGSSRHLCPAMVVPRGNECMLAVPTLHALSMPPRHTAAFFIRDLGGKPVIQAEILIQNQGTARAQLPVAMLRKAISQKDELPIISDKNPLLAYVMASYESGGRRSAYIYDARDEIFAHIAHDSFRSCYSLTSSRMGLQVFFTGNFGDHRVKVTNDLKESLADIEPFTAKFAPSGDYYKVRVSTHVDVSLILSGLFAIEHMEASSTL